MRLSTPTRYGSVNQTPLVDYSNWPPRAASPVAATNEFKAYVTDADRTTMNFGFHNLALQRISVAIRPDNAASISITMRLGVPVRGPHPYHVFAIGVQRDSLLYSVLKHEWLSAYRAR
jgi:hypothetical protein